MDAWVHILICSCDLPHTLLYLNMKEHEYREQSGKLIKLASEEL